MARLPIRIRKLIGTLVLVTFIIIYSLMAMMIASAHLPGTSVLVQTVYYVIAGLAWVLPAGMLIGWMQRPDAS